MCPAVRDGKANRRAGAVCPCIAACDLDCDGVDVGSEHRPVPQLCGGDPKHARSAAEVKDATRRLKTGDPAERQKAQCRCLMMSRAESKSGFDPQRNWSGRNSSLVMYSVDEETVGADRWQPFLRGADPILIGE